MWASQVVLSDKEPAGDGRDAGLTPGSGRSPGGGYGNSLQHSCLENPRDRPDWWAVVLWITESDTTEASWHTCTHRSYVYICQVLMSVQPNLLSKYRIPLSPFLIFCISQRPPRSTSPSIE